MKRLPLIISTTCLLLAIAVSAFAGDDTKRSGVDAAQAGFATIIVNGRTLTGPNSSAQMRDGQLLIPVAALARGLGDLIQVDSAARILIVKRQTGLSASFDSRIGQVSENGAVVLSVPNAGLIAFSPNVDEIMLPSPILSALFDAAIRFDRQKNEVLVTRGIASLVTKQKAKRNFADIYLAEYEYTLNRYSSANSHNLSINAVGRLADGRFNFTSNSNGSSIGNITPRNFTFNLERPNGQRYIAGDFGSGTALQLMTANIRGGLASIPVGNFTVAAFGGRVNSGTFIRGGFEDFFAPQQNRRSFDTNVFGISATTKPFDSGTLKPLIFAIGAMRFGGSSRQGNVVSTSLNFGGRRVQLQGDFGLGTFHGVSINDSPVNGAGMAVDLAGSFQAASNLSFQGRFAHIGSNFLAPQTGIREPIDLKAAGVAWSPAKWLTTTVNASTSRRPNETGRAESFVSTSFAISPGGTKPQFYISHTQSSSKNYRSGEFTIVNFSKNFHRTRFFANATRVKNIGPASLSAQFGANFLVNDHNTIEVNQGFGNHGALNGLAEWRNSGLFTKRLNFSAGLGYNSSKTSNLTTWEKFTASLQLPRQSSLQLSYIRTITGSTLLVSVRGSLFRKRESGAYLNASASDVNSFAKVSGRVYQDVNLNGKFDPGVDVPQADVKVHVDGNRYVVSDTNGNFRFDSVPEGDHKVYVDLLSVRADLTLLDEAAKNSALQAGRDTTMDFRLVRTGRLRGRVWLDLNGNGKFDEGETPLADVRVVTGSGRDTLTDADGYYVIGDLAPGEHVILIDEKTLPEKTISGFKPLAMQVYPGRETSDVDLAVIVTPAEVKHFESKP